MVALALLGALSLTAPPSPLRPVATYSIVARDPDTGDLGVAVQSHWFSVGSVVPWAEAGVGAVATQSFTEASYGPLGLALMRGGRTAPLALQALIATDSEESLRQVAMVDAAGRAAAHTGARCIAEAGHHVGEGYSVQANLMGRATVWPEMARAYERASGRPFAERLLDALAAAEEQGGDARGRQSAAILVVAGRGSGRPWADRRVELRVEDHPDPVAELRRLLVLHRAYEAVNLGDERAAKGDFEGARSAYARGAQLAPERMELLFWQGITLVQIGKLDDARPILERVFTQETRWRELVPRLPRAGLLDPDKVDAVLAIGRGAPSPTPRVK